MIGSPRAEQLHVLAAGAWREALDEIGPQYRTATGGDVTADFGPSEILRQRIEEGEHADLFASAGVGHPPRVAKAGVRDSSRYTHGVFPSLAGALAVKISGLSAVATGAPEL
jgi:ABC-type molybdate transport system substrate-binding protein